MRVDDEGAAKRHALHWVAAFALAFANIVNAAILEGDPHNYLLQLKRLRPGDELVLAPGQYTDGLRIHYLEGTASLPIVISGPVSGEPVVFEGASGRNTISIRNSAHVEIRNLVLDGQGLRVDAVKCEGDAEFAHHITLQNLNIRGHGHDQQTVGISTKCPAWNWVIRDSVIVGAGTGMYFGDSDGSDPFVAGLIEHNLVVDSIGYNLQIKHQTARPGSSGMPVGPNETVVRDNVFWQTAPPPEGAQPRPSMLVGHWPTSGIGSDDRYVIYRNFFYGNRAESLFQGEGNIALYNNLFVATTLDAIRIQPHNDIPRNVAVVYNTVLARGAGIVLARGAGSDAYRQLVQHNAVFAAVPLSDGFAQDNVTGLLAEAGLYLARPFAIPGALDLRPRAGALRLESGIPDDRLQLPNLGRDFDGAPRDLHVAGAYAEARGPVRWAPKPERKPHP